MGSPCDESSQGLPYHRGYDHRSTLPTELTERESSVTIPVLSIQWVACCGDRHHYSGSAGAVRPRTICAVASTMVHFDEMARVKRKTTNIKQLIVGVGVGVDVGVAWCWCSGWYIGVDVGVEVDVGVGVGIGVGTC